MYSFAANTLEKEERDYHTGKVRCFRFEVVTVEELSAETGPQFRQRQFLPFNPPEHHEPVDLSVWHCTSDYQHLSLDSMVADGMQI